MPDGAKLALIRQQAPFDTVMANILARPLVSLAPDIVSLTRQGGHVILSGLLHHQRPQVIAAFANRGLSLIERRKENAWSTLVFEKPKPKTEPVRRRQKRRKTSSVRMRLG